MSFNDTVISERTISLGNSIFEFEETNVATKNVVNRPRTRINRKLAFSSITSFDKNLRVVEPIRNIEDGDVEDNLRNENFFCLCPELNVQMKNNFFIKPFINYLLASPVYVYVALTAIAFIFLVIIIILSTEIRKIENTNRSFFANCSSNSNCDTKIGLTCLTKGHCGCINGMEHSVES